MWYPPHTSPLAFLNQLVFIILSTMTLLNFVMAAVLGPGYLKFGWKPKNKKHEEFLQKCAVCPDTFKAPRAHHCRKCNRCVAKMVSEIILIIGKDLLIRISLISRIIIACT
jgi:palmitoyltransferase ZDHHC6